MDSTAQLPYILKEQAVNVIISLCALCYDRDMKQETELLSVMTLIIQFIGQRSQIYIHKFPLNKFI